MATLGVSIAVAALMMQGRRRLENRLSPAVLAYRMRKERQAILQLGLIVGSFLLGYLPFTGKGSSILHAGIYI